MESLVCSPCRDQLSRTTGAAVVEQSVAACVSFVNLHRLRFFPPPPSIVSVLRLFFYGSHSQVGRNRNRSGHRRRRRWRPTEQEVRRTQIGPLLIGSFQSVPFNQNNALFAGFFLLFSFVWFYGCSLKRRNERTK